MITLITGIPGMGKTSLLVSMLLELEKDATRPLFVMGIPDLQIEHIVAPPVEEWTEYRPSPEDPSLELAYFTFPPNSILIVDECQRVYRPRSSASKVPAATAALETHRHTGLDIILLTQKPKLIDLNVRELVGKHIHIRAGMIGRHLYEWPHIADGESRTDRMDAAKRRFAPPKVAFTKYKSAEIHTKHKFRIHQAFYFLAIALVFAGYQFYGAYNVFHKNLHPDEKPVVATKARSSAQKGATTNPLQPASLVEHGAPPGQIADVSEHPYSGYDFRILGTTEQHGKVKYYLQASNGSTRTNLLTTKNLIEAGFTVVPVNECLLLLKFGSFEGTATCSTTNDATEQIKPVKTLVSAPGPKPQDMPEPEITSVTVPVPFPAS